MPRALSHFRIPPLKKFLEYWVKGHGPLFQTAYSYAQSQIIVKY